MLAISDLQENCLVNTNKSVMDLSKQIPFSIDADSADQIICDVCGIILSLNETLKEHMCLHNKELTQSHPQLSTSHTEEIQNNDISVKCIIQNVISAEIDVLSTISSLLEKVIKICSTFPASFAENKSDVCLLSKPAMLVQEKLKLSKVTNSENITATLKNSGSSCHSFNNENDSESSAGSTEEHYTSQIKDHLTNNPSDVTVTSPFLNKNKDSSPHSASYLSKTKRRKNNLGESVKEKIEREHLVFENQDDPVTNLIFGLTSSIDERKPESHCCPECPWAFPSKEDLQNHISNTHSKEITLRRSSRRPTMVKPSPIRSKVKSSHKIAPSPCKKLKYACKFCEKSYSKRKELRSHSSIHKLSVCEFCGKAFAQAGNMKIHLRTHTKEKPYVCEQCGKRYTQGGDLKTHMLIHTDEKPYLCEVCGNRYRSRSHLTRHNKAHTQDKPHTCKICLRSFKLSHHLKKHYRIHTQEKPYNCQFCNKAFARADYLKEHIRVHTKEKPYLCKICGKGFSQGGSLKLHGRVHRKESVFVVM